MKTGIAFIIIGVAIIIFKLITKEDICIDPVYGTVTLWYQRPSEAPYNVASRRVLGGDPYCVGGYPDGNLCFVIFELNNQEIGE